MEENYICDSGCAVKIAIEAIGGKWKGIILHYLNETKRFNELQKAIPNISQRMLTKQLRQLATDGLVFRKVYAEVPPKVEYSLTDFGRTLQPILSVLEIWGTNNLDKLAYNRFKKNSE